MNIWKWSIVAPYRLIVPSIKGGRGDFCPSFWGVLAIIYIHLLQICYLVLDNICSVTGHPIQKYSASSASFPHMRHSEYVCCFEYLTLFNWRLYLPVRRRASMVASSTWNVFPVHACHNGWDLLATMGEICVSKLGAGSSIEELTFAWHLCIFHLASSGLLEGWHVFSKFV